MTSAKNVLTAGALALGLAVALACMPPRLSAQEQPGIEGTWQLNHEESDDAQAKIQEALGSDDEGFPRPPGPGRRLAANRKKKGAANLQRELAAAEQLTIRFNDPELTILGMGGWGRLFYIDGRVAEQPAPGGGAVELSSRWDGNELFIEKKDGQGMTATQTLGATGDGNQLRVTTRLESPRLSNPIEIRRTYDRVTAHASSN